MSLNSFSSKKDISSVTSLDPGSIITHSLKPSLLTKYELEETGKFIKRLTFIFTVKYILHLL